MDNKTGLRKGLTSGAVYVLNGLISVGELLCAELCIAAFTLLHLCVELT